MLLLAQGRARGRARIVQHGLARPRCLLQGLKAGLEQVGVHHLQHGLVHCAWTFRLRAQRVARARVPWPWPRARAVASPPRLLVWPHGRAVRGPQMLPLLGRQAQQQPRHGQSIVDRPLPKSLQQVRE